MEKGGKKAVSGSGQRNVIQLPVDWKSLRNVSQRIFFELPLLASRFLSFCFNNHKHRI
jgi:hypothetical protein